MAKNSQKWSITVKSGNNKVKKKPVKMRHKLSKTVKNGQISGQKRIKKGQKQSIRSKMVTNGHKKTVLSVPSVLFVLSLHVRHDAIIVRHGAKNVRH